MSQSHKGRTLSKEQKLKISKALTGRVHSQETRIKIGAAHKGRKRPSGTGLKISKVLSGRILSPEIKQHISDGHKGLKYSRTHAENIAEARKKRVLMFSSKEELIREFPSIKEAAAFLGRKSCSSICQACRGQIQMAYGYIWKYKN